MQKLSYIYSESTFGTLFAKVLSGKLVFLFISPDYEIRKLFEHTIKLIFLSII